MDYLNKIFSEIEQLTKQCGVPITMSYIDSLAGSMREYGASEVFITVLHEAMNIPSISTDTDTTRTK